ncbi:cyclic nucleotide-binding domain-containing protein [Leptolyngbya sp. FACHB-711]|uniref:cyclic nucleotide-binding domain-containing protein n=1 Tax=unclassified Leptolyngbya TaxID=2650499 RepID=UPI0016823C71|nr:cyclic nucleotide-binding domain-containing protein [Leptolyngbya sp. FACHB-711]MBD1852297.1 cyclic nucleotide-binding domain-containing protein [Cyanobacteria bacterium FACHB-502]MBD2023844.1 cyclic nucleotide-binding domain-containing protein [Leptolyngbya sp. FACHB-711]
MTEIILRELNRSDIDWMTLVGQKVEIAPGARLPTVDTHSGRFYLVLEGQLELISPDSDRSHPGIVTYSSGDVVGFFFLLSSPSSAVFQALEKSLVLTIDCQLLLEEFEQDAGFSARFYRAIAMLFTRKQWQIASRLPEATVTESHSIMTKTSFSMFSCLHDSDICWMTSAGKVKELKADEIYVREGQSLETLDIVLKGNLLLLVCGGKHNALSLAFGAPPSSQLRNIAKAQPGDILGATTFLEMSPNLYLIKTAQDTKLLSVPIALLIPKLQTDLGFAARFYQALASITTEQLYQMISRLAGSVPSYEPGCSLCDQSAYQGELSLSALQELSIARTKFHWLLRQLGIKERT